jgi:CRP-like cAMP-binding protein
MHGFTLKRLDHNIATLTPCRVAHAPHVRIREVLDRFPHLARVYWLMTNIDAAIHREWTVSLGRRSALGRMAHLFCEIRERLNVVGLADNDSYDFPLTQQELGECLGLTAVHVNRTLQEMRRRELIELENRRVRIRDLPRLKSAGDFDPYYLYLEKRPR